MENSKWTDEEMGSNASAEGAKKLPIKDVSSDNPSGVPLSNDFPLFYSFREPKRTDGKNILFIPGGRGTIPILDQGAINRLEILEKIGCNVAYFHVRGSGLSRIDPSNKYDRFLRADYVVKDIEELRIELNLPAWDAIWGKVTELNSPKVHTQYGTDKVKKLTLIGPPSRADETHDPRRKMMVSNLEAILRSYPDDFGFLTSPMINAIIYKLETTLKTLEEEYGSINFVTAMLPSVSYPLVDYPPEFFKALKYLSFHGRPVKGLKFDAPRGRLKQVW